jgi:putative ABC transport system permease protein
MYARLRLERIVDAAAPIVTEYVSSPQMGDRPLRLLGVDPFAEAPFRSYLGDEEIPLEALTAFLTEPGAILISTEMAEVYGLEVGEGIALEVGGRQEQTHIAGLIEPPDDLSRRALQGMILADIATAQEITGRIGVLDSIDLILPEDDPAAVGRIEAVLPEGVRVMPSDARSGSVEEMTAAFRINLTALSLLALLVVCFIYNTMTFPSSEATLVRDTERLGVTRRECSQYCSARRWSSACWAQCSVLAWVS